MKFTQRILWSIVLASAFFARDCRADSLAFQVGKSPRTGAVFTPTENPGQVVLLPALGVRYPTTLYQRNSETRLAMNFSGLTIAVAEGSSDVAANPSRRPLSTLIRNLAGNHSTIGEIRAAFASAGNLTVSGSQIGGARLFIVDGQGSFVLVGFDTNGRPSVSPTPRIAMASASLPQYVDYISDQIDANLQNRKASEARLEYLKYLAGQYLSNIHWIDTQQASVNRTVALRSAEYQTVLSRVNEWSSAVATLRRLVAAATATRDRAFEIARGYFGQRDSAQGEANQYYTYYQYSVATGNWFAALYWWNASAQARIRSAAAELAARGLVAYGQAREAERATLESRDIAPRQRWIQLGHARLTEISTEYAGMVATLKQLAQQRTNFLGLLNSAKQEADQHVAYIQSLQLDTLLARVEAAVGTDATAGYLVRENTTASPFGVIQRLGQAPRKYAGGVSFALFPDAGQIIFAVGTVGRKIDLREYSRNGVCTADLSDGNAATMTSPNASVSCPTLQR